MEEEIEDDPKSTRTGVDDSFCTKEIYDRFQMILEVDVWAKQYQKMEGELQNYSDINRELQKDIRQRMGDLLEGLSFHELHNLEQEMENSVKVIRERKYKKLEDGLGTTKKKYRNAQVVHRSLLQELDLIPKDEPHYGLIDNGEYNNVLGYNDDSRILALRLNPCQPNLHAGAGSGSGSCVTYALL